MRWRWGSPWSTQIDHSDRVPAARRPHVMQPSRAYSFFIHSLWSCGPYYECNGRGYAVLPGVDIRCVPVAFSPSIKSYFHEKDNGGWGIVFTGKKLACRVFLIKRPYSSKRVVELHSSSELWNFNCARCNTMQPLETKTRYSRSCPTAPFGAHQATRPAPSAHVEAVGGSPGGRVGGAVSHID